MRRCCRGYCSLTNSQRSRLQKQKNTNKFQQNHLNFTTTLPEIAVSRGYVIFGCIPVFIKEKFFSNKFKVATINNAVPEYYTKLSDTHAQMRRIGNNYNQVVKELKFHFSERKAMAMLYNLEKATRELVMTHKEITSLTKNHEQKWQV